MQRHTLYSTRQFDGLHSAKDPLSLGPGQAKDATNIRKDIGGPIKVRNGIADVNDVGTLVAGTYMGCSELYDDGTNVHILMAWKEADNDVHIYWKKYVKSTTTWDTDWTLLTADSGKFGDTALVAPTDGYVQFFWAEIPADDQTLTGKDYHSFKDAPVCYVSDGTNVRVVDLDIIVNGTEIGDASRLASHCKAIPPPKGNLGVEFDANDWMDMNAAATGGNIVDGGTDWATPTLSASVMTFATAAGSGSPAILTGSQTSYINFNSEQIALGTYTSDTDYFMPKQVWLVVTATDLAFFENIDAVFRYKIGAGALATEPFPSAPLILPTNVDTYYFVIYDLPDLLPEDADEIYLAGVGFTSRVTTPVSCTIAIYAIGVGGVVPGGTEYGICRRNRSGHIFSPGVVLHNTSFGTSKNVSRNENPGVLDATERSEFNGIPSTTIRSNSRALPAKFVLPIDSRVYYTPKAKYSSPSQGDLDDYAAEYVCIYRKEPGDPDYYRVDRVICASYASGSWSYESGFTASSTEVYTDVVHTEYREFSDRLPDESCSPIKPFRAGISLGSRGYTLSDSPSGCNLQISEHGNPSRYVDGVAQSDDAKGGFNVKIAREKGRAISQSSMMGGNVEAAQVLVFTDSSVWAPFRLQGDVALFDMRRVASFGAASGSIGEMDGPVAWLDKDREIRVLGTDDSLSRYKVSDKLLAIPDGYAGLTDIAFWKGRLYVAYTPTGATENQQVLVYNALGGYWEGRDTPPADKEVQQFVNWRINGANKLYYLDSTGGIREYEKASTVTDDGTAIAFLIETGEFHNDDFEPVVAHRMGVVADNPSVTLTTTRTGMEPSATETATLDLSTGSNRTWKWDKSSGKSEIAGLESVGIRLKFTGSFSAACSFYAMVAEIDKGTLGGASV